MIVGTPLIAAEAIPSCSSCRASKPKNIQTYASQNIRKQIRE